MADQWYHIGASGDETGPLSAADLAAMVRSGALTKTDRLRKEGTDLAIPAARLKGLFPEERREPAAARQTAAARAAQESAPTRAPANERRWLRLLAGVVVIALSAGVFGWLSLRDPTFPEPRQVVVSAERQAARQLTIRAPTPKVPSIAGLPHRAATPVPGLEEIDPAYAPSLTHDLRMIVFAGRGAKGRNLELYQASRGSPNGPFSPPVLIESCSSPELDAYPAISPDGLELVFVRGHAEPTLYYASRANRQEPFGEPVPWDVPNLNPDGLRLGRPQFVDRNIVAFRRMAPKPSDSRTMMTVRSAREQPFREPTDVLFANASPQYFLAAHLLRAYSGSDRGMLLTARSQREFVFPPSKELVDAATCGPVDGPMWVAPKEDVIFYCSAGPGEQPGSRRRLWMLRY